MTTRKILITLPEEDAEWLDSHPEISKSGLFQKMITYLKTNNPIELEGKNLSIVLNDPNNRKDSERVSA